MPVPLRINMQLLALPLKFYDILCVQNKNALGKNLFGIWLQRHVDLKILIGLKNKWLN